jgi:hypothetical protein
MARSPSPKSHRSGRVSPMAPESQSLSAAIWNYLESLPGFNEDLRQAERDLEAGRGTRYELRGGVLRRAKPHR